MKVNQPISRRNLLRASLFSAVGVVLAACGPKPTAVPTADPNRTPPAPGQFSGEISFYAQNYLPNSQAQGGGVGLPPRQALAKLAEEWMAAHPYIKLTFFQAPLGISFETWINSQIMAGGGPDVFRAPLGLLNAMADQENAVTLNDYLALANPHTPEVKAPWRDAFRDPFPASASPHGKFGGVPLDRSATGIYCNRDLLAQAGINFEQDMDPSLGAPRSWQVLLDWCAKLKAIDVIPFSLTGSVLDNWLQGTLVDQLMWHQTAKFDVLNYHLEIPQSYQLGRVSQEELMMQFACNDWQPFSDPAVRSMYEIIKGFTPYLPVGYQNASIMSAAWEYFLQGRLALLWDGCWRMRNIVADNWLGFAWDSFWLPALTSETTQFAKQPPLQPIDIGGFDSCFGINRETIKRANLEDCVDWLMFITTPANAESIVNEVATLLPAVKGAAAQPDVARLFGGEVRGDTSNVHDWLAPAYWFGLNSGKYTDTFQREMMLYLLEDLSLDDFMLHADEAARGAVSDIIVRNARQYSANGLWDLTRWPSQPVIPGV
ncbi:MAG: ABC transporter substrate-binding protein [Anaerolineae bacterium]